MFVKWSKVKWWLLEKGVVRRGGGERKGEGGGEEGGGVRGERGEGVIV